MIFPVCPVCSSCDLHPSSETGREHAVAAPSRSGKFNQRAPVIRRFHSPAAGNNNFGVGQQDFTGLFLNFLYLCFDKSCIKLNGNIFNGSRT